MTTTNHSPLPGTPLPRLSAKLAELTGAPPPGYRILYNMALDGRLPTIMVNGRHYVEDANLLPTASALGMVGEESQSRRESGVTAAEHVPA